MRASVAQPDLKHIHHRLLDFGLSARQTCFVFYSASGLLGAVGLTIFGHRRVIAVVVVAWLVLVSTLAADKLAKTDWRIDSASFRRLLGTSATR
jgi:hypothetical protein